MMLPLHIFEDRYKEMIGETIRLRTEFGVVQAGEKGIVNTGCTATIEKVVKEYTDGRLDILTLGRRRFEIMMLNDDRQYLRGAVQFFDDEDPDPPGTELRQSALEHYEELRSLELDEDLAVPRAEDNQLSFRLAVPIQDLDFRQMLLATKSEKERLRQLVEYLPKYVERRRAAAHVREVAPRNGHSKWPANL